MIFPPQSGLFWKGSVVFFEGLAGRDLGGSVAAAFGILPRVAENGDLKGDQNRSPLQILGLSEQYLGA